MRVGHVLAACWPRVGRVLAACWRVLAACWLRVGHVLAARVRVVCAMLLVRACRVGVCRVGRVSGRAVFETPRACACRVSAMLVRVATQRAMPCYKSPCWRVRAVLDHLC